VIKDFEKGRSRKGTKVSKGGFFLGTDSLLGRTACSSFLDLSKDKGWLFQMVQLGPLDKSGNSTGVFR